MNEFLTGILVIITGVYAWLTCRIAKANEQVLSVMRSQTVDINRPYIIVRPVTIPGDQIIYLRVSNTGRTAARNVRLAIDRDFYQFAQKEDDHNLRTLNVFRNQVDCFPPGMELNYYLGTGPGIFGQNHPPELSPVVFNVTATYSFLDQTVQETTTVDLRPYLKTVDSDPLGSRLEELIKVMEKLNDTLGKRAGGIG